MLDAGDSERLKLLSRLLEEQDLAKAALGRKGYGCTGMPWLDVVDEVHSAVEVTALYDASQYEQS